MGGVLGTQCGVALVVDSDKPTRDLVVDLLGRAGYECVIAGRADEALIEARSIRPWLVVSDVRLPDISGYELCRGLRDEFGEEVAIVFLSADRNEPMDRVAGLLVGADDYMAKPFDAAELMARVRRLAQRLLPAANPPGRPRPAAELRTATLTAREREALTLLALGHKQREIAEALSIGEKTVASHLQRVLEKLGVHSRAHAVAIAYQDGLVGESIVSPV
jgi:DNA-binding NarL/FixJ family response regulator